MQSRKPEAERSPFWRDAIRRVDAAGVDSDIQAEEMAAYAIEHRERAPNGIRSIIDNLIGVLKDFVLRKWGKQLGEVTPGQMRSMTLVALRAQTVPRAATSATFSLKDYEPQDFVPAPDGSMDFGEIGQDVATLLQREAAPIRLRAGNTEFGLRHIEMKGREITSNFEDGRAFVEAVARNYTAIYQASGRRLMLALKTKDQNSALIVELSPTPDGSAYTVVTGGIRRRDFFDKKKPLWEGAQTNQSVSRLPDAISGQSGADNISNQMPEGKKPRFSVADPNGAALQSRQDTWLKDWLSDKLTWAMGGGRSTQRWNILGMAPLRPMLEELTKDIPAAKGYLRTKQAMDTLRNEWHSRVADTIGRWKKFQSHNRKDNARLMEMMHESTLAQADPTKPFEPLFTAKDATTIRYGKPESAQYKAAEEKAQRDKVRRAAHKALKARMEQLSPEARALYEEVRDTYTDMADSFEAVILGNMDKALKIAIRRAEREHRKEMQRIWQKFLERLPDYSIRKNRIHRQRWNVFSGKLRIKFPNMGKFA